MPSVLDTILAAICWALEFGVLAASIRGKSVRRYFFVNLYVGAMLFCGGMRCVALGTYGFQSPQYFYSFYLTDALLVTTAYLLILSFFEIIFKYSNLRTQIRLALLFFIVLVGIVSDVTISRSLSHFYSRLLVEFLQNMYFAAVILTVLLWISVRYLRVNDRQMGLLIAGLGLCFSTQAAGYALQNLLSRELFEGLRFFLLRVPVLATIAELGLWCYALAETAHEMPAVIAENVLTEVEAKGTV